MLTRFYAVKSEAAAQRQVARWARAGVRAGYVSECGQWVVTVPAQEVTL